MRRPHTRCQPANLIAKKTPSAIIPEPMRIQKAMAKSSPSNLNLITACSLFERKVCSSDPGSPGSAWDVGNGLRKYFLDHLAAVDGRHLVAIVVPIGEPMLIDAERVEDGGVQIVGMDGPFDGRIADG